MSIGRADRRDRRWKMFAGRIGEVTHRAVIELIRSPEDNFGKEFGIINAFSICKGFRDLELPAPDGGMTL